MKITLDTRQKVTSFRHAHPHRDVKIGDMINLEGNWCPTCFHQHDSNTDESAECWRNFPPVMRVRARVAVDCPSCDNTMIEEKLVDSFGAETHVIMCCNRHCRENGKCYKPPTVRLAPLYE